MGRLRSFAASRTSSRRSRNVSLNQAGSSTARGLAVCATVQNGIRSALASASRSFISVRVDIRAVVAEMAADESVFVPDQSHHENIEDRQYYQAKPARARKPVHLRDDE